MHRFIPGLCNVRVCDYCGNPETDSRHQKPLDPNDEEDKYALYVEGISERVSYPHECPICREPCQCEHVPCAHECDDVEDDY